jgi:hypothetical protein
MGCALCRRQQLLDTLQENTTCMAPIQKKLFNVISYQRASLILKVRLKTLVTRSEMPVTITCPNSNVSYDPITTEMLILLANPFPLVCISGSLAQFTLMLVLYSLLVDVQFVEYIIAARENGMSFAEWPLVDSYVTRVVALPRLAAYLASDRRYPYPGNLLFK